MKKVKWGFMAAGRICSWMATAMDAVENGEKYCVASRTLEKGQKFAETYGFQKAYGSYEEMLQDPEVDLVYIGTPVGEHYRCIKMSLEAGKNVLCEKSLTVNADQAKELAAIAREKNLFLMEGMWMKCQPAFRKMKEWIAEGKLGEVQACDVRFYTACGKGHRLYNKATAGGAALDLGVYDVTYACELFGYKPEQVISHSVIGEKGVDYFDSIVMTFPGGKVAHLSTGLGAEKMISAYVLGSKARITVTKEAFFQAEHIQLMDYDNNVLEEFDGSFRINGFEFEATEVSKCILEGKTECEFVRIDDTIAVMEILDQVREKAGLRYECE